MIVCIWLEVLPEIRWLEVTRDRSSAIFARKLVYTETTLKVWTFEIPTHVDVFQDDSCSNKMIRQERLVILIGERLCWSWNTKRLAEQSSDWAVNTFGCLLVSSLVSLYCRLYQVKVKYYRLFQFCASLWSLIPQHKFTLDLEQPRSSAKRSDHRSSCRIPFVAFRLTLNPRHYVSPSFESFRSLVCRRVRWPSLHKPPHPSSTYLSKYARLYTNTSSNLFML